MSTLTSAAVEAALSRVVDPYLEVDPVTAGCIQHLQVQGSRVQVKVELGYPAGAFLAEWQQQLQAAVLALPGVEQAEVEVVQNIAAHPVPAQLQGLAGVKNVIAVASGKGGVGKSTTAVNLALALAAEGARVGILDADIYGPSQGLMLGVPAGTRPQPISGNWMAPINAHGLQVMSMAFLADEETPMAWRGPMASGALLQLITQSYWDNLDYLVIDMPPGTGDIQLTLAQKVPVAGALIVTTPQDIALLDARRGIELFTKVNIPVLGVVENMAVHVCSNCGHAEHVFGAGGGEKLAEQYGVDVLASLPLSLAIREQADGGNPTVIAAPGSMEAGIYRELARRVGAHLALAAAATAAMPSISISED